MIIYVSVETQDRVSEKPKRQYSAAIEEQAEGA